MWSLMLSPFSHDSDRVLCRETSTRRCKRLLGVRSCELLGGSSGLLREESLDLFHDFTWSWIPKAIRINDFSIININTELTKATLYNFNLSVVFFSQLGRHPGSHDLLDGSNRAVMYGDFLHRLCSSSETVSVRFRLSWTTFLSNASLFHHHWRHRTNLLHKYRRAVHMLNHFLAQQP